MALKAKQKKWFEYMALMLELHHDNGTRFDLEGWITIHAEQWYGDDHWCGQKGCACGLAAFNPTFIQAGFAQPHKDAGYFQFNGNRGWEAVTAFFGITTKQAVWLFHQEAYTGQTHGDKAAKKVAKRIRAFIASGGKTPASFNKKAKEITNFI